LKRHSPARPLLLANSHLPPPLLSFPPAPPPPRSTLFPYTTLFRSRRRVGNPRAAHPLRLERQRAQAAQGHVGHSGGDAGGGRGQDRKSTRLNSSHVSISYAVFCLKKKKSYKVRMNTVMLDVT